jgi:hypothetical protein
MRISDPARNSPWISITASRNALSSQLDGIVGFAPPLIRILKSAALLIDGFMARLTIRPILIFLKTATSST